MKKQNTFAKKNMHILVWWLAFGMIALTACQKQSRGFVLPEGDIEIGKQVFTELNCTHCHSIADIAWAGSVDFDDPHVKLGGDVTELKTYGELVTSIINPSHKISQKSLSDQSLTYNSGISKMETYSYNEILTVQELIDIVTFLQSEYELVRPQHPYPYH